MTNQAGWNFRRNFTITYIIDVKYVVDDIYLIETMTYLKHNYEMVSLYFCRIISGGVTTRDLGDNDNSPRPRTVSCPDRSNPRSAGLHTHTNTQTHT